ncbi:MAG: hypothetical protein K2X27_28305 [Candidatus Obscuribacterales bacterium]|nr:hypothetical protein [Candidatus Obscuribacterales bacterium]
MSPEKERQLSLFLIYGTRLHPDIRLDIERSSRHPQKLFVYHENPPMNKEKITLTLKSMQNGDYNAIPPADYKAQPDSRGPLATVYKSIAEHGGKPPDDLKEQTLAYYKAAVEKKNYFDAVLAITEYGLQTGENIGAEMAAIKNGIAEDPDCQKFVAGVQSPQNEKAASIALGALDMIDRSKSPKSYLIDIFRANLLITMADNGLRDPKTSQESDPAKAFIKVLEQNPFIAGVYNDLGNYYESAYMHGLAWDSYELARRFYPRHPFLTAINEKEQELAKAFPQFIKGDKLK